ncbi:phosphopantetheine-binding protein [Pseudobacteriovorax antillogorgiicola]|uniref:Acyl carrier protein n=1 Tax=Pseudobacteriovorax antillogorgiicola TaxID=1513793 RepID=A0A1Y6B8A2_9BACT|nr:phosphopantetheine-binding protein [Pseudobacteriovorax antillogorgiicola]TCS58681.1 acyl carrier protein [Pseudobacteriovorax antillogorgiicola]SME95929.1 acyl carrier protein [Pseudobacteriovorax antillogorgiicola]
MENQKIYDDVVKIISKHAKNQEALASLNQDTHILNDLQVNSARLVDIILDFEDAFDLEIEDDDADEINTIGDAVQLVQKLVH